MTGGEDNPSRPGFETFVLDEADLNPSATIRPLSATLPPGLAEVAWSLRGEPSPITMGSLLGEGGSGRVYEAVQPSLGRVVAAKQLKTSNPEQEVRLIQEAWTAGHLEHPNIVTIHDLALDGGGRLTLLLQRIHGQDWRTWIRDPEACREALGVTDVLGWNLGVLIQVCHAIEFAHSKGVVHRDIKPENVMVGAFGEVLLVDWGVAIGLTAQSAAPTAAGVAGTPRYMAPEMVTDPTSIDERSDVYLLGAVLFELLTGHPPHHDHLLREIANWVPALETDAPAELRAIALEALSPDPAHRYPTAEAFRRAITTFVEHRASLQLTDSADELADEHDFEQSRFRYRAALSQWAENPRAIAGLSSLVSAQVRRRLIDGDALGAKHLISDIGDASLKQEVHAAVAEERRLDAVALHADPVRGAAPRRAVWAVMGLLWIAMPLIGMARFGDAPPDQRVLLQAVALQLVAIAALGVLLWPTLAGSPLNQRVFTIVAASPVIQLLNVMSLGASGATVTTQQISNFLVWGVLIFCGALLLNLRLLVPAIAFLAALPLISMGLAPLYPSMAVCNAILVATLWSLPRTGSQGTR